MRASPLYVHGLSGYSIKCRCRKRVVRIEVGTFTKHGSGRTIAQLCQVCALRLAVEIQHMTAIQLDERAERKGKKS